MIICTHQTLPPLGLWWASLFWRELGLALVETRVASWPDGRLAKWLKGSSNIWLVLDPGATLRRLLGEVESGA